MQLFKNMNEEFCWKVFDTKCHFGTQSLHESSGFDHCNSESGIFINFHEHYLQLLNFQTSSNRDFLY